MLAKRLTRRRRIAMTSACVIVLAAGACSAAPATERSSTDADRPTTNAPDPTVAATPTPEPGNPDEPNESGDEARPPVAPATPGDPLPFVPAGRVGDAGAYEALIDELAAELPAELRSEAPWPDLRAPDPVDAQLAIFDFWIWMAATRPEPALAAAMAAEGSPSREELAAIFGGYKADGVLHRRESEPYVAHDHRVVTFASAGLPLWLARDVPDDAVVVYYRDRSGPTTVRDDSTGDVITIHGPVPDRQWLSIMVPTEFGWLLFRDQLIEPGDTELEVPEQAPPSPEPDRRTPEV